jgi:hypothetical protein
VKALNNFKKNFWKYLLVDGGFVAIVFFLLVYAKQRVENFFILFETYQAQLEIIEPELMNQTLTGLLEFEGIINEVSALVNHTYIFVVFLVPLVIYLLFCLSQSYNFSLAMNKKFKLFNLLKFFLLGLPFFVVLLFLFDFMFDYLGVFLYSWEYMVYFVVLFVLILFVFHAWLYLFKEILDRKFKFKLFKKWFFDIKKSVWSYLLMVLFAIISLLFFVVLYVRFITWSFSGLMWIPTLLAGIVFLLLFAYFRVKFVKKLLN